MKINYVASNVSMLQFKNLRIHQNAAGDYYYDGTPNLEPDHGILVDFNIEHEYLIFELLGSYWGGWNETPTWEEMLSVAKKWDEEYSAKLVEIDYNSLAFKIERTLSKEERAHLIQEIKNLRGAMPCYNGGVTELEEDIVKDGTFEIWWD